MTHHITRISLATLQHQSANGNVSAGKALVEYERYVGCCVGFYPYVITLAAFYDQTTDEYFCAFVYDVPAKD